MKKFKFYVPLSKDVNADDILEGIASTTSIDRDDERMSENALNDMREQIMKMGINLFGNHEHSWENTLGVLTDADIQTNQLFVKIKLDDPTTNPKIPMMLNKLKRGIKLGLSVGGEVIKYKKEYVRNLDKEINVIDRVKLYELSLVGIASNPESFMSIPNQITKCLYNRKCPVCLSLMKGSKCKTCLWSK